ncbi:MAG TPA: translational GTPase TypA [Acidimicrobiia bacterium]|nr:translational GTPase TypA [Acidimicrobiia bacterium]
MTTESTNESELVPVEGIRNIAIIAHVDHGKTTLVDAMLRQTGSLTHANEQDTRIMDSGDLEREKGITILAKNTAVRWRNTKINIVDTPGHADFGGEVERALQMVDSAVLLVDAAEGPLPQTRFVLRKALALNLPLVVIINKVDRPDARIAEVIDEVYEMLFDIDADEHHIDFPIVYAAAKDGWATLEAPEGLENPHIHKEDPKVSSHHGRPDNVNELLDLLVDYMPAPKHIPGHPLQAHVTNLGASAFVGRLAICRMINGTIRKGQQVAWMKTDGTVARAKVSNLYITESNERAEVTEASAGELVAVAGLSEVTIGETLADPENPVAMPVITVDEPALAMTIGINTSPLAGKEGDKLTASQVKNRLEQELVGNVALRMFDTNRPDAWEVHARGELQLAVLVEQMRREGFELTVGKPIVLTREIDGKVCEPTERVTIDTPEEFVGAITQLLASRKGRMENLVSHGTGWARLDYIVPSRGLIGFKTDFMTETRGSGVIHHTAEGWEEWAGEIRARERGSIVADRLGQTTGHAITLVQERATLFVAPGEVAYLGMIVGENSRNEDMDVNIVREKQLTNMRASGSDHTVKVTPPKLFSLEGALEFIADDECVEVTPKSIRMRKVVLDPAERARTAKKRRQGAAGAGSTTE